MIKTISVHRLGYFAKVLLLQSCLLAVGCETTGEGPTGKYEHGVFIVNEGGFGSGNGTLSFRDPAGMLEHNIFRNTQGDFAGDVLQSLSFDDDGKGYIVVNGDSKIEIVDAVTFKGLSTITDATIDKPRYMAVVDDKAFISVWGPYDEFFSLIDSYVLVWDLVNGKVVTTIDTDEGTEELLFSGGVLFATNYNFGASNTVALIDPVNNVLFGQLVVASKPRSAKRSSSCAPTWVASVSIRKTL
jgi:WD40 repeat protein